jgi:hypothetical protein
MLTRVIGLIALLLGPACFVHAAGYPEHGRYIALGAVLAAYLCLMARPLAPFAVFIPVVYAAAAFTAQISDGVAALIVAVAAAVGAASSQGLHRGLLAVLAAALIGTFEPATSAAVLPRALAMLAGCTYGWLLVWSIARSVELPGRAVRPRTALGYAVLLAVLVLVSWYAARLAGFAHGWWLPLAVAAVGEPSLIGSARSAVARTAAMLFATVALLALADAVVDPRLRLALVAMCSLLAFVAVRRHAWVPTFLLTPVLVLLVGVHPTHPDMLEYLRATAGACAGVFACAVIGKWALWVWRPDIGRVTA